MAFISTQSHLNRGGQRPAWQQQRPEAAAHRLLLPRFHAYPRPLRPARALPDKTLRVITTQGYKAYWLKPYDYSASPNADDQQSPTRGAVLFMHGFAQSPKAYYTMLKDLSARGFLVVAPSTGVYPDQPTQQGMMVDRAEFFLRGIRDSGKDGSLLESLGVVSKEDKATVTNNIALLAHSVGAGLSTHVAAGAAAANHPFKAVVTLAPLTSVIDKYAPETALEGGNGQPPRWPAGPAPTKFLVQYGLIDLIAPVWLADRLKKALGKRFGSGAVSDVSYVGGTHVGFQDQIFVADTDVDTDILPGLNAIIVLLALGLPGFLVVAQVLLRILAMVGAGPPGKGAMLVQEDKPGDIEISTDTVKLESDEQSLNSYRGLLAAVIALTVSLGFVTKATWDRFPDSAIRWVPLVLTVLSGFAVVTGSLEIPLNRFYVDPVQREESKKTSVAFIARALGVE